jgi:hypothetical protein
MALGLFEEAPRFTTVWAPPSYRVTASGPVTYAAISRDDRLVGYLWVAGDEDAADFLAVPDLDERGFEVAVWWVARLRQGRADQRHPRDPFDYWIARAAEYGMAAGEVQQAESLAALYELAGRPADEVPPPEAGGRGGLTPPLFLPVSPADYAELEDAFRRQLTDPAQERQIELLDQALAAKPVPEDLVAWRNASAQSFNLDWQYLPNTVQRDPAYLAVALARFDELETAEVVLHLRVAAGIPAIYLNVLDEQAPLPAPTLLLRRGLSVRIHDVRRRGGQWYVQAAILPPEEGGGTGGGGEDEGEGAAARPDSAT